MKCWTPSTPKPANVGSPRPIRTVNRIGQARSFTPSTRKNGGRASGATALPNPGSSIPPTLVLLTHGQQPDDGACHTARHRARQKRAHGKGHDIVPPFRNEAADA